MRGVVFYSDRPYEEMIEMNLTKNKFSCDYKEDGFDIHVEAFSRDGFNYIGNWGDPVLDTAYTVELKRFDSTSNEVILVGPWKNADDNREGVYLFRLNQ